MDAIDQVVELGKSGGGLCYGYKVTRGGHQGEMTTGEREIVSPEAEVIRRIFRDYAAGVSPKALAKRLNGERRSWPNGKPWNPSTIHGNPARGTGILNNELYVGRLVWNRPPNSTAVKAWIRPDGQCPTW